MVFVCFVGIKKESFGIGRSVLPKFFLEDVGYECFDVGVVGRDLKVFCGYYLGLMEGKKAAKVVLNKIFEEEKESAHVIVNNEEKSRGILYVCNHRTLVDPIYVSIILKKPVNAVTYSLSKITELFSPIKTVRLARKKEEDSKMIEKLLSQGDVVICPEGTTCREPYLLRFSPLFAETSDVIVPIAIDYQVSMFYGTTASGLKCLDPVFQLMNPTTTSSVKIFEKLQGDLTCGVGKKSKFEVANYVQAKIAQALGFECTNLTRKDKYMILAGNEGKV
uniref:Phospholipid/glycerol acyltransferase domain-containing protein n=1 Tax=Fagus sylvatica TaxID=28930 RepID=A0A2N9FST1_FAGSY